ncbi:MAG TPA: nuclear transport factor 2 family protein [Candidatus Sulfotelmatobacter sp.]|jgi:hypothetical protein|nr:nuclear transport factor 2 family protein [Candidatus Sulfotelmatobacter sp.]
MKKLLVAVAILLSLATTAVAQKQQEPKSATASAQLEVRVRKLWEAFKNKDKATLSSLIDDNFRQFEEGLSAFGDKKTEVNSVDEFELLNYTLTEFTIKSIGPNAALVTYIAQYEGKSGGETSKGHSVFGEVWTRSGNEWKVLYMQETYVK